MNIREWSHHLKSLHFKFSLKASLSSRPGPADIAYQWAHEENSLMWLYLNSFYGGIEVLNVGAKPNLNSQPWVYLLKLGDRAIWTKWRPLWFEFLLWRLDPWTPLPHNIIQIVYLGHSQTVFGLSIFPGTACRAARRIKSQSPSPCHFVCVMSVLPSNHIKRLQLHQQYVMRRVLIKNLYGRRFRNTCPTLRSKDSW